VGKHYLTVTIRPFAITNRSALIESINAVCSEGQWMNTSRFEPTPAWTHALRETLCPDHSLLVVEDKNNVVGWCRTFPEHCPDSWSTASLGVGLLPFYRNRGIGTALVRQSLIWAGGVGLRRVRLTTYPDNARAIRAFIKCGFYFTGRTCNGSVEMACNLPTTFKTNGDGLANAWETANTLTHKGESTCEYVI